MYFYIKSSIGIQGEVGWPLKCFNHPPPSPAPLPPHTPTPVVYSSGGPGVSLTLCWFVVCSGRRFVLSLALCYFVLVLFSPFSIAITSLREERANLGVFRTFVRFALVWFCLFPLPFRVWDGLRLGIVALPILFSYLLFSYAAFVLL